MLLAFLHLNTDIHYFHENKLIKDCTMSTKPTLIKLRTIETLLECALSGNIYKHAFVPLLYSQDITELNANTWLVKHLDKEFKIRCDLPINTSIPKFVDLIRNVNSSYITTGAKLFKDITDINSLGTALTTENTFSRGGVTVTTRKVQNASDDGTPMIMEYKVKTEYLNKEFTTRDEDELLTFIGSLSRHYSVNLKMPDPNWNKVGKDEVEEVKPETPVNVGTQSKVGILGGRYGLAAAVAATMAAGTTAVVTKADE